nr:MurR/RpiR family transcriptional regulator [Rhodococcus sp. (in: high G+C Gram-positive bacteria)]
MDLAPGGVVPHIRSLLPSLLPAEKAVAEVFVGRPSDIVEMSSQQVADAAGASRASVVRTCQSLGFSGYQQLRVLLARDAARALPTEIRSGDGPFAVVVDTFSQVGDSIDAMTALLDERTVTGAVEALATAATVVVVGNGLSAPLASDADARLRSVGVTSYAPSDAIAQQVAAKLLTGKDVLLVVSGSGATAQSTRTARIAREQGATVIALTSFARSDLAGAANFALVVGMRDLSFQRELSVTSRIPHLILLEGLMAALTVRLGDRATAALEATYDVISGSLSD